MKWKPKRIRRGNQMNAKTKKRLSDNMIWIVLIVLVILVSIINPKFLTIANLRTLLTGESIKGIMAFGVAFAILTRGLTCRSVHPRR